MTKIIKKARATESDGVKAIVLTAARKVLADIQQRSTEAIKALDQRTNELQLKTAEVEQLRAQVNDLRLVNSAMEKRLSAIEQRMQKPAARKHKASR